MKIGITGHQKLADPSAWERVKEKIEAILLHSPQPLVGISCLAMGADQIFADLVLKCGGVLEAIIPFAGYEDTFTDTSAKQEYQRLLTRSARIETLVRAASDEQSFFDAGKRVVDLSDCMIAVWNGKPAAGLGGTADVVRYAQEKGKEVIPINPTHHATILIVDDPAHAIYKDIRLWIDNYEIVFERDPVQAKLRAENDGVVLAVFEIRLVNSNDLQDHSGLEVARSIARSIPKLIFTEFPDLEVVRKALSSLDRPPIARDFFAKEEGVEELVRAIRHILKP